MTARRGSLALFLLLAAAAGCRDGAGPRSLEPPPVEVAPLPRPQDLPPDLGTRAFTHVQALVGFGARHPGSPGWRRGLDYAAGHFEALGLPVRRDRFTDAKEGQTFENLAVRIPGGTRDFVVLGAHHDTKLTEGHDDPDHNFPFVGANDSASGVGLLLALAAHWARHAPPVTLELVLFDGEESIPFKWNLERALFGSRRWVAEYRRLIQKDDAAPRIRAMILLDMVAAADLHLDDDSNSDRDLKSIFLAAAKACGHERYFFRQTLAVTDDHLPFREAGIPVLDLIDLADNPQWHTRDDTLEHVAPSSLQIVGEVVLTALPAVARRYFPSEGAAPNRPDPRGR